jgi:activating signal cointegrator 1
MLALTVRQPFASLIIEGVKSLEYRKRPIRLRGRIAIHAAAELASMDLIEWARATHFPHMPIGAWLEYVTALPLGAVLGTVRVCGTARADRIRPAGPDGWFWAWRLQSPEAFPVPIPARGSQSFWRWNLPA